MSCLFNSLSHFLNIPSQTIRQTICEYLASNEPLFEDLDTRIVLGLDGLPENYVLKMRNQSTWGGAIEINAACNIWNLNITVCNIRDRNSTKIIFQPIIVHGTPLREIVLEWSGNHYSPVRQSR
jgi:hypothetical protein